MLDEIQNANSKELRKIKEQLVPKNKIIEGFAFPKSYVQVLYDLGYKDSEFMQSDTRPDHYFIAL